MTMEVDRVERAAMRLDPMPAGLEAEDQIRFLGLRYLYGAYKRQIITRDQASAEKRVLLAEIVQLAGNLGFERKCLDRAAERYKKTEAALNAYRTSGNRTPEADLLADVIDGFR